MQISLTSNEHHSIQSYSETSVTVNQITYHFSLIVNRDTLINDWGVEQVIDLNEDSLQPLILLKPDVILIGHKERTQQLPFSLQSYLSQQRIGIECMPLDAACRTFNVLLSENRPVVLGVVLPDR